MDIELLAKKIIEELEKNNYEIKMKSKINEDLHNSCKDLIFQEFDPATDLYSRSTLFMTNTEIMNHLKSKYGASKRFSHRVLGIELKKHFLSKKRNGRQFYALIKKY